MISPCLTTTKPASGHTPLFFRTCWNNNTQAKRAASFVVKRGWVNVAIFHNNSGYGQGLAEDFAQDITS